MKTVNIYIGEKLFRTLVVYRHIQVLQLLEPAKGIDGTWRINERADGEFRIDIDPSDIKDSGIENVVLFS